ncbi:hypothetical protein HY798_01350 [Candidatus Falkowbacteria bacterium]|nr:hypothetical protein [Candidatus Falkowbacteria bacterium]
MRDKRKGQLMVVGKVSPHLMELIRQECNGRYLKKLIIRETLPKRIKKITHLLCTRVAYKTNEEKIKKLAERMLVRILVKRQDDLCHLNLGNNIDGVFLNEELGAMIDIHFAHILQPNLIKNKLTRL